MCKNTILVDDCKESALESEIWFLTHEQSIRATTPEEDERLEYLIGIAN
jgi:hypothetical protein